MVPGAFCARTGLALSRNRSTRGPFFRQIYLLREGVVAETTTDHETIRQWAEGKGGKPAAVERTHQGGDVGIVRIMFPKTQQSEHESLVEISWDEFFEEFDKRSLALIYEKNSMFNKIVGRDTAERRAHGEHGASRH